MAFEAGVKSRNACAVIVGGNVGVADVGRYVSVCDKEAGGQAR